MKNICLGMSILLLTFNISCKKKNDIGNWLCYYGPELAREKLEPFTLVILDPDQFKDVSSYPVDYRIGYLSIGEAETYRGYWPDIKDKSWLGDGNPNWKNNIAADIRSEEWQYLLMQRVIPKILARGYNGLFLDTVTEAIYPEIMNKPRSRGKIKALTAFIRRLRHTYPDLFIIQNSALQVLGNTGEYIDALLIESLVGTYDFQTKQYIKQPRERTQATLEMLRPFTKRFHKPVFVIDYVDGSDSGIITTAQTITEQHGYLLYLAEIDLQRLYTQ